MVKGNAVVNKTIPEVTILIKMELHKTGGEAIELKGHELRIISRHKGIWDEAPEASENEARSSVSAVE